MKMSSHQYWILTDFINQLEEKHGKEKIRDHRETIHYANDQFISFVWSIYYMIPGDDRKTIREDLLDQHIQTALVKALKEYR